MKRGNESAWGGGGWEGEERMRKRAIYADVVRNDIYSDTYVANELLLISSAG